MNGQKIYRIEFEPDELRYVMHALTTSAVTHAKNGNHDSSQKIRTLTNEIELLLRRQ